MAYIPSHGKQVFTVDISALAAPAANETPAKKSKKSSKKENGAPAAAAKPITARSTISVVSKTDPNSAIALISAVFSEVCSTLKPGRSTVIRLAHYSWRVVALRCSSSIQHDICLE